MTADEFEILYAERSGTTVEKLRAYGRIVAECHCGDDICKGWVSILPDQVEDWQRFHGQ